MTDSIRCFTLSITDTEEDARFSIGKHAIKIMTTRH